MNLHLLQELKKRTPWWGKIAIKIGMARFPIFHNLAARSKVAFVHGQMDHSQYAYEITSKFVHKYEEATANYGKTSSTEKVGLEFGCGDSLNSAIILRALGFSGATLVNAGNYASMNIKTYISMHQFLKETSHAIECNFHSVDSLLESLNATYLTNGIESLRSLPSSSIDFFFSNAVLEHVRTDEVPALIYEMHRIMKNDAIAAHQIDFRDHLGQGSNNLRFPRQVWESPMFASSGFYTNRWRYSDFISAFSRLFNIQEATTKLWAKSPIKRSSLADEFRGLSDEDLMVSGAFILLTKKPNYATPSLACPL